MPGSAGRSEQSGWPSDAVQTLTVPRPRRRPWRGAPRFLVGWPLGECDYFNRDPVVHTWTYKARQGRMI
jgi:hypothetical protein